jgi:thiamine pyrophosphokinase
MDVPRKAFIFTNGELAKPPAIAELIRPDDLLVAADGGLRHLTRLGLRPDWLVGDLDSVAPEDVESLQAAGVRILRYPVDKDETDLELALQLVISTGYTVIRIIAALGGRLDQTLGNLFLLQLPELADCDVRLEDGREEVLLIRQQIELTGQPGDVLSLLPLGGPAYGIRTEGLRYPLHDETLWPERTRGISNVFLGDLARVRCERGMLLCIHTHSDGGVE